MVPLEIEQVNAEGPEATEEYDLRDNDVAILRALNEEDESIMAFQGLRRKLGLHQEALSRALQRLERDELVQRTPGGYKISSKGLSIPIAPTGNLGSVTQVLQAYLPQSVDLASLTSELKGRWFGGLRWLGQSYTNDELVLTWLTEDGAVQLNLRLAPNTFVIETQVAGDANMTDAVALAHRLYNQVAIHCMRETGQSATPIIRDNQGLLPAS